MSKIPLAVIGGGPAGYVAALVAAREGMGVTLFEKDEIGGTCLNRGCIPTKTYLQMSHDYTRAAGGGAIRCTGLSFDMAAARTRKDEVVASLRTGIETLLAKRKVTVVRARARFLARGVIEAGGARYEYEKAILAVGSDPRPIPALPFDGKRILDSTDLLDLDRVPATVAVVGGGVIGVEFACFLAEVGARVTVIELEKRILPMEDKRAAQRLAGILKKRGVEFRTGVSVASAESGDAGVRLRLSGGEELDAEIVLVGVGRKRLTEDIGLDALGVATERGMIAVDDRCRTNIPDHWACGDAATNLLLAHVASHMGEVAAMDAAGKPARLRMDLVPAAIYTHPELASIGLSAEAAGKDARTGRFSFAALGRALAMGEPEGYVELRGDAAGRVVGATILGPAAADLVTMVGYAIRAGMSFEQVTHIIHPHPSLSEALFEAAADGAGTPVHSL